MILFDRRKMLSALGLTALGGMGLAGCSTAAEGLLGQSPFAGAALPNIIWIISDDQSYSDYGFMGNTLVRTPHLDRLASQSALFPNGYVPTSLCRASLATLITGKYAFDHGICFNDPPKGIPHSVSTSFLDMQRPIPLALQAAGYRSLQTGKFWEGAFTNGGFTDGMTQGSRHGDAGLKIGRQTMEPIQTFLSDVDDAPFFLWFAPYLPHAPFDAVDSYKAPFRALGLDERTVGYYANISWLDDSIGKLLELLEASGKADNTVIIYITDNGWLPNRSGQSHRDLQGRTIGFDPRSKQSPYEGGVRTPVFVHWPGKVAPGRHDDLISSIDLFPTTLSLAGLPRMPELPGIDLVPFLRNGVSLAPRTVFGEIYYHTSRSLDDPRINMTHRWARKGDWKLILNDHNNGPPELYNLAIDPNEKADLANGPEQAERVALLSAEIANWWPK